MIKKIKFIFFFILISAVFSDQLFLSFLSECEPSVTLAYENSISDTINNNQNAPLDKQDHKEDCPCTFHFHHCSSHHLFVSLQKTIKIKEYNDIRLSPIFYVTQTLSEQFLDSLFRPPKA